MSNEPFRMSEPSSRDSDSQPEFTSRSDDKPSSSSRYESKSAHRSSSRRSSGDKPKSSVLKYVGIAIGVGVVIAAIAWVAMTAVGTKLTGIDSSKYQAVFFTNGQVYFGKLATSGSGYLKLTDVFYLQTQVADDGSANPQKTATEQQSTTLIKLGEEIHGPEDAMIISEDQVLFYENLKKDGKVSQSIEQYKKEN